MLTIDRVIRRGAGERHAIEMPFTGLNRLGFGLASGQLGMVVAAPGLGKSSFAMHLALASGLPTLYVSPDTDAWTMTVRVLANLSGHPQTYVTQCLGQAEYVEQAGLDVAMHLSEHVQFSFDTYSTRDIKDDVLAYGVVHGSYPELIVVDNLRNVAQGDNERDGQTRAIEELHALSQMTGAHVLVLHHATGQYDDGDRTIPLSGVEQKLSKLPAQILSLHAKDADVFACVIKNRQGRADPSGRMQVRLRFDKERMRFSDYE
jgi:replicative DNA helicase